MGRPLRGTERRVLILAQGLIHRQRGYRRLVAIRVRYPCGCSGEGRDSVVSVHRRMRPTRMPEWSLLRNDAAGDRVADDAAVDVTSYWLAASAAGPDRPPLLV